MTAVEFVLAVFTLAACIGFFWLAGIVAKLSAELSAAFERIGGLENREHGKHAVAGHDDQRSVWETGQP